jgi:16S rRNA (guanine(527)-N(7))-methyltransferase RsmG
MNPALDALLARELERARLSVDARSRQTLSRYLELLETWGQRLNLTARPDPGSVIERLLPDVLVLASELEPAGVATRVIDVGSGAGLPGLVLALLRPDLDLTLVEARAKRCAFLRTARHALGLTFSVLEQRLEGPPADRPLFDVACSQAALPPERWLTLAARLVGPGGRVVAFLRRLLPSPLPVLALERQVSYALADGTPRCLALYRR